MIRLLCLLPLCACGFWAPSVVAQPDTSGLGGAVAFLDHVIPAEMRTYHTPGVEVALVTRSRTVLTRGYGYADVAHRVAVDPRTTLFRLCAASEVVTAVAALQLAAQHKLKLHTDVNRYLTRFKLASTFVRPVTMADLLTDTGGFGDRHLGRRTLSPANLQPLGSYLARFLPLRLVAPGKEYAYSIFGFLLAAYVEQLGSHQPFPQYVARRVFRPLHMGHSTFGQVLPPHLGQAATGYTVGSRGAPQAQPMEYLNTADAAGMWTTAGDMAHFLRSLLNGGSYQGGRILTPATVRQMEAQHFTSYPHGHGFPPLSGVAYGWGRYNEDGQLLVEESGALRGFSALAALLPQRGIGFFIAANTANTGLLFDVQNRLLDHYFPARAPRPRPPYAPPGASLAAFTGSYWSDEYAPDTIEKLRQLANQVQVSVAGRDTLAVHFWTGRTARVTRVSPLLFEQVAGKTVSYWVFITNSQGQVQRLVPGGNEVYDRIAWYATTEVQAGFIALLVIIFLSGIAVWLVVPLFTRRGKDAIWPAIAGWLAGLTCVLNVLFLVTLGGAMVSAIATEAEHYSWLEYGVPGWVMAVLTLPLLTTALAGALAAFSVTVWRQARWSLLRRLHYSLVTAAALAFIPFLLFWNLLGYHT